MFLFQGTRPDLAFAISQASRFNKNFNSEHWGMVRRIFRYLKSTADLKLVYRNNGNSTLTGYCDASYASEEDVRSRSGYVFILQGGAISWFSKRQPTMATSSTIAEYRAITEIVKESIALTNLGKELGILNKDIPTRIIGDNQPAILLIKNSNYSPRTKHVKVQNEFIKEILENKEITLSYINTHQMFI